MTTDPNGGKRLCPQCGETPWATYYERSYGVAPEVAIYNGWPLGHQWAVCVFGHRWVASW